AREGGRPRVQPVVGPDLQGGHRELALRRAGGGLRVPLHEPRVELPRVLAAAVLPLAARPHAARDLLDSDSGDRMSSVIEDRYDMLTPAEKTKADKFMADHRQKCANPKFVTMTSVSGYGYRLKVLCQSCGTRQDVS